MSVSSFSSPWPDPNSPVLSKIDFGVPLVELLKWLDVRDTFLGDNRENTDIAAALSLARDCKHPDAVWLTSIFEGKGVYLTKQEAKEVFLLHQDDARALCFAWWLTPNGLNDLTLLRRASEMGNAFACATLCEQVYENKEEAFRLAQIAVAQHERDGFYWLGRYFRDSFRDGVGCEKAMQNLFIAAELGNVFSAECYGRSLGASDPARWFWHGRAALHGLTFVFLHYFSAQVNSFFSGSGNATVMFLIGRALNGNIDLEKKEIFGDNLWFHARIGPANQAITFYESQAQSTRLAVDTWTLVSTRLHLIKDMRIFIGKMIWEARFEGLY